MLVGQVAPAFPIGGVVLAHRPPLALGKVGTPALPVLLAVAVLGQPALFGTTDLFLERLGLDSLDQLPAVEDFLPGPDVAGDLERDLQSALGLGVEASADDV